MGPDISQRLRPFCSAMLSLVSLLAHRTAQAEGRFYLCRPALPAFCQNIHVGCSGATNIPTSIVRITISGPIAQLDFEGSQTSARGRISQGRDLVIRIIGRRDWLRIEQDGRYSHRIYRNGGAAMSYGLCDQASAPNR